MCLFGPLDFARIEVSPYVEFRGMRNLQVSACFRTFPCFTPTVEGSFSQHVLVRREQEKSKPSGRILDTSTGTARTPDVRGFFFFVAEPLCGI